MTSLPPESHDEQPGEQPAQAPVPPHQPAPPHQAPEHQAPQHAPVPPASPQHPQPGQPQYQQPAGGGYQQPPAGYQQPVADPVSNITLNYWLSVFFFWVPALIFFLVDKDRGDDRARQLQAANLNFSLLRTFILIAAYIVQFILLVIPYVGWLIGGLIVAAAWIIPGIFHIIAATKVTAAYRSGQTDPFIVNTPMVK